MRGAPVYRFPDGTTYPTRAEAHRATRQESVPIEMYGAHRVSGTALRYREYARRFEPDPALANDPEVVAVRQEIAAIDAAREIDEPTPEPAPAGAGATWTPLRERPAGRWVED